MTMNGSQTPRQGPGWAVDNRSAQSHVGKAVRKATKDKDKDHPQPAPLFVTEKAR
jgi:hypothetical protein